MTEQPSVADTLRMVREEFGFDMSLEQLTQVDAAIRCASSGEVREGWKLVPVEPTDDMLQAGIDNCALSIRQDRAGSRQMTTPFEDECGGIYQAMLAVAPTPPVEPQGAQGMEITDDMMAAAMKAYRDKTVLVHPIVPANHFEALDAALVAAIAASDYQAIKAQVDLAETTMIGMHQELTATEARIATLQQALEKIQERLSTAFGAGVFDLGPPAPGTEGSREHHRNGNAQAILTLAEAALNSMKGDSHDGQ